MQTRKQAGARSWQSLRRHTAATILATSVTLAGLAGCRDNSPQPTVATIIDNNPNGIDPANANLAPAGTSAPAPVIRPTNVRVLGQQQSYTPQQSTEQYPQQQPYPQQQYSDEGQTAYDSGVAAGYDAIEQADQPPPPLPVYDQPPAPEPNDLWTPGYWNYAPQGYFWVPGAWVAAPYAGALWTPGYWGYEGSRYRFHRGFWARHIGFYGGINYGFGYTGLGYSGGYWNGNNFYYNRAVNRVNITNIHTVYERNVTVNNVTRVSYNGGNGGLQARPDPRELAVLHEQRTPAMATQIQLRQQSAQNRQQFFNQNHGQPAEAFAPHPVPAERGIVAPAQPFQQQRPANPRQQQFEQQRIAREQAQPGFHPQVQASQQVGNQQRAFQQQQVQERNVQASQQQQNQFQQQHPQANQQRMQAEQQQRVQAEQQQRVQPVHVQAEQQQRGQAEQQQRATRQQMEQQQRSVQQQPHTQQFSPRPEPMQRAEPQQQMQRPQPQPQAQRPQPQPQPQVQHVQPQPQVQHFQPQPQQHAEPQVHSQPR